MHCRTSNRNDFKAALTSNYFVRTTFKAVAFLVVLAFCNASGHAAEDIEIKPVQDAKESTQADRNKLLEFIYGKAPKNGIIILPYGIHTQTKSKDFSNNNLIGVVYNSFSAGTFINSFHDRTWYLVLMRNIIEYHGFGVDYFAGALYGYKGKLATVDGIPFRNTFLFKHNLNPVISIDAWYKVTDHVQAQIMFTSLVVLGGIKYNF